nr:MFS transporter [Saccharobesus litoralis]
MIFIIRGDVEGSLTTEYHLTKEQMGEIWGPAFLGFTIAIFFCGALIDKLGMKRMHVLSAVGFIAGTLMILFAPQPDMADGTTVSGIFSTTGTTMLYGGFLLMGLAQGTVEGVINPLIATMYKDRKAHMLNVLHAFWPLGLIIGGILALIMGALDLAWQIKIGIIIVPSLVYLFMALQKEYPQTERVAANISTGSMFKACLNPLFILLWFCMWLTAATELAPDQWFPSIMKELTGLQGTMFLVYTAGLMFVLRFFFGGVVHKHSPFLVLTICAVLVFVGLYWLGSLDAGSSAIVAFAAATVFGVGKTYFWPTMLGITAERFPKSGALGINLMGGAGMLSIYFMLPIMGKSLDTAGPGEALISVSYLAIALVVIFAVLFFGFKAKGGYKAEDIEGEGVKAS